ncbi:MAG: hypothetical protein PHC60_08740 [Heliobacteriaceae bacterium]|nr:hypothetical protein [Heliobacteriaceae bacterium]MDD4588460.1 hypothetical protein [Heliobacteriaceae bacterium]
MAWSTCAKCGKSNFEMVEATPRNSAFKLLYVQCAICGAVAGVMDYVNPGSLLQLLGNEVDRQGQMLTEIKEELAQIKKALK